ncbi:MAG TPA: c-type cytochrome domain-containing protein, partial [Chitinophagaceae bacterium]|nr:c-type cytochrome domain-containing protein [Chitinophagaceae bacterium]
MTTDILSFFGRFHPLFVHLPIGFLCFAILLEMVYRWKKDALVLKTLPLLWLATAVSASLSAASGYFLSRGGGYDEDILQWHKIGGITMAVLSIFIYLMYVLPSFNNNKTSRFSRSALVLSSFMLLIITGHWGGSLTHGSDYLTTVDEDEDNEINVASRIKTLDSADVFKDAVMPIFQAKCVSCHNTEKKKGELLLTGYEEIIKGGKTRAGIIPGNTASSEIYRRITLPKDHKEFMPSNGKKPLTETQTAILEWWIETGAHRDIAISKLNPNKKTADIFNDFFQLDREAILAYQADPASDDDLAALIKAGFQVNAVSKSGNLLEVKFHGNGQNKPDLELLTNIREQLVWLHLTNCGLTDQDLKTLGKLPHLYKLNLNRNKVSDQGVVSLGSLTKLEYLNLYGTEISDTSLPVLMALPELRKLYVWETKVDSAGV